MSFQQFYFYPSRLTLKAVFEAMERQPEIQKEQGRNPHYLLQKYLILDDMESLLQEAHVWLSDGIDPHLLRCLTHVVLFLRKIGHIPQHLELHCIDILEACVKVSAMCKITLFVHLGKLHFGCHYWCRLLSSHAIFII